MNTSTLLWPTILWKMSRRNNVFRTTVFRTARWRTFDRPVVGSLFPGKDYQDF